MKFQLGNHQNTGRTPWNKGLKGAQVGWNKGIKYVLPETKRCKGCKLVLPAEKFGRRGPGRQLGQLLSYCCICAPKESAKWRTKHPEQQKSNVRKWEIENRDYKNEYRRNKVASNPQWKIALSIRNRFSLFIRRGAPKDGSTLELFGASLREVQKHLEALFRPGMSWENYGPVWEIDHIRPCASFDLTVLEQQRACFHFSNIQPLFVLENRKKGDRYETPNRS